MILHDLDYLLFELTTDISLSPYLCLQILYFSLIVMNLVILNFTHLAILLYNKIMLLK